MRSWQARAAAIVAVPLVITACDSGRTAAPPAAVVAVSASPSTPASPFPARSPVAGGPQPAPTPITVFGANPGGPVSAATCPDWVVLATRRLAYTDAEVHEIANALAQPTFPRVRAVPPTLRSVAAVPTRPAESWQEPGQCDLGLQITNVSRSTIRIPRVGWRSVDVPEPNREVLRLIDYCSTVGATLCGAPNRGGGVPPCDWALARITVAPGPAGTDYFATPVGQDHSGNPCRPITLRPGQSVEVETTVDSALPYVYRLLPVVVVVTPAGSTTVEVPALVTTMAFGDPIQFSCYQLRGHAYVWIASGPTALRSNDNSVWCV